MSEDKQGAIHGWRLPCVSLSQICRQIPIMNINCSLNSPLSIQHTPSGRAPQLSFSAPHAPPLIAEERRKNKVFLSVFWAAIT